MRIAIYGGSFNPVHFGHVNLARRAVKELELDRLIVVPANVSPFKTGDAATAPWPHRLELVKSAFAAVEQAVVDERELRRGGVSYAIDTVREIAAENPGARLYFLIGEDSVAGLPRWKDYEQLKELCEFKAYERTPESSTEIRRLFAAGQVVENPDPKVAAVVREGVLRKQGYCPCRLQRTPENFCPCDEFKRQLADPAYHGFCHCRLYLKA